MEAGQVRSVYLTLNYHRAGDRGVVVHEIQFRKDGKSISESTLGMPVRPDRLLFDKTLLPERSFVRCERIGSELYLFAGESKLAFTAYANQAYVVDVKSSGGELVKFHGLPYVKDTSPNIIAAHGRLYHLAVPVDNRSGIPMPFEVYDPFTKSWDPLPPIPQCPFIPYANARKMYLGYAVWGTCILFSFGYPGISMSSIVFVPVLFDAGSRTWHQVYVAEDVWRLYGCFPWRDKAVVVGDTVYALGFKKGTVISFSITKSGSEEDGSLSYSLTKPDFLGGLNIVDHPKYNRFDRMFQCWCPLGDFEFCLVLTIGHAECKHQYQPFVITTFKIIHKKGTSSCIETLYTAVQCTGTQDYGRFWPIFCYNPDYEPEEVKLTMKEDIRKMMIYRNHEPEEFKWTVKEDIQKERNRLTDSLQVVDCDILDITPKEASLTNRKVHSMGDSFDTSILPDNQKNGLCNSMALLEPEKESSTNEKNEKSRVKGSPCNVECLKPDFELGGESSTNIKWEAIEIEINPGMVDSHSGYLKPEDGMINSRQVKCRKRRGKHPKKKGSEGSKRDSYIVSLVKCHVSTVKLYGRGTFVPIACLSILFIGLTCGLFSLPETGELLFRLGKGIGI